MEEIKWYREKFANGRQDIILAHLLTVMPGYDGQIPIAANLTPAWMYFSPDAARGHIGITTAHFTYLDNQCEPISRDEAFEIHRELVEFAEDYIENARREGETH